MASASYVEVAAGKEYEFKPDSNEQEWDTIVIIDVKCWKYCGKIHDQVRWYQKSKGRDYVRLNNVTPLLDWLSELKLNGRLREVGN